MSITRKPHEFPMTVPETFESWLCEHPYENCENREVNSTARVISEQFAPALSFIFQ